MSLACPTVKVGCKICMEINMFQKRTGISLDLTVFTQTEFEFDQGKQYGIHMNLSTEAGLKSKQYSREIDQYVFLQPRKYSGSSSVVLSPSRCQKSTCVSFLNEKSEQGQLLIHCHITVYSIHILSTYLVYLLILVH